mmetsp:Transcript_20799/g.39129  ORF Transcript_20799/g.39129 Transcript_20799/m.39129 type:complete len:280 (-) Transcript_20799:426-1265(-)
MARLSSLLCFWAVVCPLFKVVDSFQQIDGAARTPSLSKFRLFSGSEEGTSLTSQGDWRELRASLISKGLDYGEEKDDGLKSKVTQERWAHKLTNVEVGSVLLDADTGSFSDNQRYFKNSVILIIRHDEQGSVGLILNRPSGYNMGEMIQGTNLRSLPGFEESSLYMGGDVGGRRSDGMDCINLLHGKQYAGITKVVDGLYLGGLNEAIEDVKTGRAQADEFRFFSRYCGWARGQLNNEINAGFWLVAATDVPTLLEQRNTRAYDMWMDILSRMQQGKDQ